MFWSSAVTVSKLSQKQIECLMRVWQYEDTKGCAGNTHHSLRRLGLISYFTKFGPRGGKRPAAMLTPLGRVEMGKINLELSQKGY